MRFEIRYWDELVPPAELLVSFSGEPAAAPAPASPVPDCAAPCAHRPPEHALSPHHRDASAPSR